MQLVVETSGTVRCVYDETIPLGVLGPAFDLARLLKSAVQRVADETGLEIRVAHYPPYTSKYNPIEHRLFPHLSRACRGVVLHTVELVRNLMETAHTATGLEVSVDILRRMYQTGLKATAEMKDQLQLLCDDHLGKWNYRLFPNPT